MPTNHPVVAAIPDSGAPDKELLRELIAAKITFVVQDAAEAADLVAVDPDFGVTLQAIASSLRARVGHLQCPEHHEEVRILATGPSVNTLSFELAGCCAAAIEEVQRRLS